MQKFKMRTLSSLNGHLLKVVNFSKNAPSLRRYFDQQFENPQSLDSKRFVWDYWNVPNQYRLIRTPAYHYFPENLYMSFHESLVQWGRKTLGCWDISPPWLSYYVEGCKQEFHSDVPHGPWAYVFSLSPKKIKFSGGETILLRPEVLNYWQNFGDSKDREKNSFLAKVPSPFNQLTVFDPRLPHGVSEVRGVQDPRDARLVIHGWFMEPKTYIEGALSNEGFEAEITEKLNLLFDSVQQLVMSRVPCTGTLSLQLKITAHGKCSQASFATNTLIGLDGRRPRALCQQILKLYLMSSWPKSKGATEFTIPLIFQ
jgi:hypothetical protein